MCVQPEAPVALTSSGRPKRGSRRLVDYNETDGETPHDLEKYLERVRKEQEQRSDCIHIQLHTDISE